MRKVIEHCKTSTVHVSVMYVCFRCINKVLKKMCALKPMHLEVHCKKRCFNSVSIQLVVTTEVNQSITFTAFC